MGNDRKHEAPAVTPGSAHPARPTDEDEYSAVAAGEPEAPVGPSASMDPDAAGNDAAAPESQSPDGELADEALADDDVAAALDALTAKAEKAAEYLELAQRTKADFENYRKRALREAAAAQERGVAKLALELLPAVDNLDRALEAAEAASGEAREDAENGGSQLVSGIKLVHADVIAALARVGIEPFSPKGERFDPQHHEAIAQQPVQGAASGTVVEVYQRGYRLGENVLRPARVVVAQ